MRPMSGRGCYPRPTRSPRHRGCCEFFVQTAGPCAEFGEYPEQRNQPTPQLSRPLIVDCSPRRDGLRSSDPQFAGQTRSAGIVYALPPVIESPDSPARRF